MRALMVPCVFLGLFLSLGVPAAEASTTTQVPLGWTWDQVEIQATGTGEVQAEVAGCLVRPGQPGEPALPVRLVRVAAPDGHGVASLSLEDVAASTRTLEARLAPVEDDRPAEGGGPLRVEPDAAAYGAASFPVERVRFVGITLRRGVAYANFVVYPLTLEQGERLSLLERGVLEVTFTPDAAVPLPLKTLRSHNGGGERRAGEGGGSDAPGFARPLAGPAGVVTDRPAETSAPVDYVVLTTAALEASVQDFVLWKNQMGTATVLRTMEWVQQNYPDGVDAQERIRHFLTDAYRYWGTQWLLIVGGPDEVPIRRARSYSWQAPTGVDIITDLYYGCLDGTWNKDGDAIFGEPVRLNNPPNPIGDEVDFDPEIFVGRIPATRAEDVTEWLQQKYFRYARSPITDGYLDKTLFLGEALFAVGWTRAGLPACGRIGDRCDQGCGLCISRDGADDCVDVVEIMDASPIDRTHVELYEHYEYWNAAGGRPNALLESQAAVIQQIDAGMGIIHHVGHGDKDRLSIGTNGGTDGNGRYLVGNARAMANGDRVSVVYAINCNSAAIDYDCIGEVMLFAPNGGAVTYVGSSNLDFPNAAAYYQNLFYEKLFQDGAPSIGQAYYETISEVMAPRGQNETYERFVAFSLILLGEPQMSLWLNTPSQIAVNAPTSFTLGQSTLAVDVTRGGNALPGATVCAYKANDVVAVGTTDLAGHVDLAFQPTSVGTFMITATHPAGIPHMEPASRVVNAPPAAAAVSVTGLSVVDSQGAQSAGNDNGRFEEGETILLGVILRNAGGAAASGLTLNLQIDPPELAAYIEVLDATQAGVNVPANTQSLQVAGAFRLHRTNSLVPENLYQNGDRLPIVATVDVVGATTTSFPFPLPAHRPLLDLEQGGIDDSAGNGNGIPEDGERILWSPLFRNRGIGTSSPFHVKLTALGGATIEDGDAILESGEVNDPVGIDAPLSFTVGNAVDLSLQVQVVSDLANVGEALYVRFDRTIDLAPPTPPLFSTETPPVSTKDAIVLTWSPSASTDVQGYILQRSLDPNTGFAGIHQGLLRNMQYYRDEGLPGLTRFYYRAAAVDSSGNRSAYSNVASATTAPAVLPGWPFSVRAEPNLGCPTIENLDGADSYEIFLGADNVYGLNVDGTEIIDGDGISSTPGIWSPLGGWFWSKPAIADLDGDGNVEIVATSRVEQGINVGTGRIYAWRRDGSLAWQKAVGSSNALIASPVIANIDADPQMEVIAQNRGKLYAWNHDGSPVISSNADGVLANVGGGQTANGPFTFGSPAAADLDGDNDDEIIQGLETDLASKESHLVVVDGDGTVLATAVLEIPAVGEQSCNGSPSLADVDGGGVYEIFYATRNRLWAFNYASGALVKAPGWPASGYRSIAKLPTNWTETTPAVGDVDGDGDLDVVLGAGLGQLEAVDGATGQLLTGFPRTLGDTTKKIGSAILVNMDADLAAEILVGNNDGTLFALNADGTSLPGFPYVMGGRLQHGITCWDVDRDGHPNLVVQSDLLPQVTILDISNVVFPGVLVDAMAQFPWCSFRHDARNTGTLTKAVITPVLPLEVAAEGRTGSVMLSWNVAFEPQAFEVQRQGQSGEWIVRARAGAGTFRVPEGGYRFEDPAEPGEYLYRVLGYGDGAEVMYESPATLVTVLPFQLRLVAVAPNPFRPRTAIRYETPGGAVGVDVVDLGGRLVRRLAQGLVEAGPHELVWDGRDDAGHEVGSGIYMVRLSSGALSFSRKIVLLR